MRTCDHGVRIKKPRKGVLRVIHYGDTLYAISRELKARIKIPFITVIEGDSYFTMTLSSGKWGKFPGRRDILEAVKMAESHKHVKSVKILKWGKEPIILMAKKNYGVLRALYATSSFLIGPLIVDYGVKYFPVILPNTGVAKELERLTAEYSPVPLDVNFMFDDTLKKFLEYDVYPLVERVFTMLTPAEKEAVIKAYSYGYFEWPKRVSSWYVAQKLGVSKSTFCEHIRKAEKKIFKFLLEKI